MTPASVEWFDEIDLDPDATWLRMATRQLGARPWLVVDELREVELALKNRLLAERPEEVFDAEPGTGPAGEEVLGLIIEAGRALGLDMTVDVDRDDHPEGPDDRHPLDRAGRSVQEDLCLLRPGPDGWVLAGASLCFPSRWRLADKMGRTLTAVHGPVEGYRPVLADRVDTMLDRLAGGRADRIVWRRNWFVHPDPALFQPDRPPGGEPIVGSEQCLDELHLRSERQTLRSLPATGWILFTIRIQQAPLRAFLAGSERRDRFARWLRQAPTDQRVHRGLAPAQIEELEAALGAASRTWSRPASPS